MDSSKFEQTVNSTSSFDFVTSTVIYNFSDGIIVNTYNDVYLAFSLPITILYIAIFMPIWLLIILGNSLVILAFVNTTSLRKVSNYFLISLACTDLFTGIISLPLHLVGRLVISPITCWSSTGFLFFLPTVVLTASSAYHLIAIAIDRLISVCKPLKYPNIVTSFRAKVVMSIIWFYNISFGVLPIFIPDTTEREWTCRAESYGAEQDILTLVIAGFIPVYFLLMTSLYMIMLRKASQHVHRLREMTQKQHQNARNQRRGLVTMAMLVGAFGLCFLPSSFQFTYEVYGKYTLTELIIIQTLCEYPLFLNSCINPIIYALRNDGFNKAMKTILCSKCMRIDSPRQSSNLSEVRSTNHSQMQDLRLNNI